MTTAPARAVLRSTLMAAASSALLVGLAQQASAASCTTTTGNDTCVINLGSIGDNHDGQAGSDTLQFNDAGQTFNTIADDYTNTAPGKFLNFEIVEIVAGTTLNIVSSTGDTPAAYTFNVAGILNVSGAGNAIADSSALNVTGTFNVNESETIGSLTGTGSVVIANGEVLTTGGSGVLTTTGATNPFSGIISGAGGLTKDFGSTLWLTGNNSYTGATTVAAGTLVIGNAGAIDNSSSVTTTGGVLAGTVAYTINGPVTNGGQISGDVTINGNVQSNGGLLPGLMTAAPAPNDTIYNPGQSMGTIAINGNYTATGSNAFVGMFVDLDAALPANGTPGTTHDFLNITGNVTGTNVTRLFLAEWDSGVDLGAPTTGNGIQLIRVTGTTTPGAFVSGNALNSGAYQYLLRYVADYSGTDDGYFLQSAVRDEMIAHPAMLSASQQMIRGCFRDDQRVPDSPKGATYGRAWFGYHQGATQFGADTGIELDLDYSCSSGGMDWRLGYGWFGGVSGGFGSSNGDLATPAGTADLDGSARVIEAYTSFTSSSFFVNLSAGYADTDWDLTNPFGSVQQASVSGLIAQAQAGLALDLEIVAVKLIGAVNYDDQNCGEDCFGFAATEDTGLIEGKGTVRFDGVTWGGSIRPWAAVSYSDVLSDGVNTVSLGAVSVSSATNDELLSLDAGLQTYLDENFSLFVDGGYHESLSKDINGYKAGVGLKLYW
jgi:autotransporter-associated beta strand protein